MQRGRPVLVLLTSHWISMLGVALVTLAGISWIFALPSQMQGHVENPYIGLLLFIALPALFFAGLALIPVGIVLAKRKLADEFTPEARSLAWRRVGIFFAAMTLVNVAIGSQLTYRAVSYMETPQFCGQQCHVMQPEFTAHTVGAHTQVACANCHIEPGAAGWVKAKMAGTNQLVAVLLDSHPRPIESALENNKLVSSTETCEGCHQRELNVGNRVKVITKYAGDEANTRTQSVLTLFVGGGRFGGIHGAHMGPGVQIRYAAADKKRQTIPWVEYQNTDSRVTRTYLAADAKAGAVESLPKFDMQCADCHNRAAHAFESADRAIDEAILAGKIPNGLPFVKKTGLALIQASYTSREEGMKKIEDGLCSFYAQKYPDLAKSRSVDITAAGKTLSGIYSRNVFPDLKVTWGTYVNNLGHIDSPGCFRCHDDAHATMDKKTITQDCSTCHQSVAADEASPEVLKTLGMADKLLSFQKQ